MKVVKDVYIEDKYVIRYKD